MVDDDVVVRELCRFILGQAGYVVETAENGGEALTMLGNLRPDLILMDWVMPAATGVTTLARIRARPGLYSIPVLFVTSKVLSEDRDAARVAGVNGYVTKPFRAAVLLAEVERLLGA